MELTKEAVASYASHALNVRNRKDVYNACVILLRNWHLYSGDDERLHIFNVISSRSVTNQRLPVASPSHTNHAYDGWKSEMTLGKSDPVLNAYESEMNKR